MSANRTIADIMMDGFETIEEYWSKRKLDLGKIIWLKCITLLLVILKYTYRPIKSLFQGKVDFTKGLDRYSGLKLKGRGTKRKETHGGFYLSDAEVKDFERTGICGPFKVFDRAEAKELEQYIKGLYSRKFDKKFLDSKGIEFLDILEKEGQANLRLLSIYQALNYKRLWDAVSRPEVVHRMASLLGDDVICWRSQVFDKSPNTSGTVWHQQGTFKEVSRKPKLTPPPDMNYGMVQLSSWVALTDTTIDNGCLRIVESSFEDDRLEQMTVRTFDNKLDYILEHSPKQIETIIKTLLYTAGSFPKAKLLFEMAFQKIPDLLKDMKVRDFEMKAGEAIIFTSVNVHGSYPNVTDSTRMAISGRYTSNDVQVYKDFEYDSYPSPRGPVKFKVDKLASIQVHGADQYGHNLIATKPADVD